MISYEGKVALVVGGTSGIGRAAAVGFARQGSEVVVAGRREEEGEETVRQIADAGGQGSFVPTDVRREEEIAALVARTVERHGRLDCAFNAACIERYGSVETLSAEDFDAVVETALRGTFLCIKHELPAIRDSGGGAIVNASSQGGTAVGVPTNSPYTAAKAGIAGLSLTAALEGAPSGVRVNTVRCANIASTMAREAWASFGVSEERIREHSPVGRVGAPEDVANAVLFLCSDEASFITGAALPVDGGWVIQPSL